MCRVCNRIANVLRRWDRRREIDVVPSQTDGVMARFPWIPARAFAEAMQLVGPGGETWQGAAAIEKLLDILPRGGWIAWIFRIPFARAVADRCYRWFARNRYHLGCGEHCPTGRSSSTASDRRIAATAPDSR
jgi:predicted DCC family thiol-disulfide oxidoreductase YuxK